VEKIPHFITQTKNKVENDFNNGILYLCIENLLFLIARISLYNVSKLAV